MGYRGVSISLRDGAVSYTAAASWQKENLTEQRALLDFKGMQKTVDELRKARGDFNAATSARPTRFSLVEDYGTGVVELCHLAEGKVVGLRRP